MNKIQLSSLKTELYNLAIGLGIKIPDDHPHRRLFLRLEREAKQKIETALDKMRRDLFRGVNRSNAREILQRAQSREINEQLRLALFDALKPVVLAGTGEAQKQIERDVLGVKAAPIFEIGFNWEMVNTDALAWLQDYTYLLTYANVYSITATTEAGLRKAIEAFIQSPDMTMNQLSEQVAGLFDPIRANMIAVTEVTRTFAQANIEAWRSTGVIEKKRWNTANDELVCPICGPLNGQVVGMDESFNGTYDSPPAHPRCRCWVTPVVEAPTELDIINQKMEAILNERDRQ